MRLLQQLMLCIICLVPVYACANMSSYLQIGQGWREADVEDEINGWAEYDSKPYSVVADFDNDGVEDIAKILLPKVLNKGVKIVAVVSNQNNPKQVVLEESIEFTPQEYTISLAEPSETVWESACGKGYYDCKEGEIARFKIRNPSIYMNYSESYATIFMWSHKNQEFINIPLTD